MLSSSRVLLIAAILSIASGANAATVSFPFGVDGELEYFDVFYTVTPGGEFLNWQLQVQLYSGSILDPDPAQRSFNAESGAPPIDTFANTVLSSVGAGSASYVFSEYNPGSAFPPVPPDPAPAFGATPPNPNGLDWTIFDTAAGDVNIDGFFPYHMARVVFSRFSSLTVTAHFFDTTNAVTGGEVFSTMTLYPPGPDPDVPEPAALLLAAGASTCVAARRRQRPAP